MKMNIGQTDEMKMRAWPSATTLLLAVCLLPSLPSPARAQECTRVSSQPAPHYTDTILHWFEISHLLDFELTRCVLECILVKLCVSFNYDEERSACTLNSAAAIDVGLYNLMESPGFDYYELQDWDDFRQFLAGTCAERPCAENQRCITTVPYQCVDVDCGPFPYEYKMGVPPWQFVSTAIPGYLTSLGSHASLSCQDQWANDFFFTEVFYEPDFVTCNSDFTWSTTRFGCSSKIKRCDDVKQCNPTYEDGHYLLQMNDDTERHTIVYCHNMSGTPETYLTLPPQQNIARDTGTDTIEASYTTFSRVRLTPEFDLDIKDFLTDETTGSSETNHFGTATSCPKHGGSQTFRVDLTGTGYMLKYGITWTAEPEGEYEVRNLEFTDTTVVGECGGTACGRCYPTANIVQMWWLFNPTKAADGSEGVVPECTVPPKT